MAKEDLREHGSETRTILRLALPVVLTQVGFMMMGLVDTLMVSRLGTEAMAAASLGHVWVWGTMIFSMSVLFGLDPIVSQAHGSGDGARTGLALQRGLVLAVPLALPVALLWWWTGPALELFGQDPALAAVAAAYVRVQIPSILPFLLFAALRQYLGGRAIMAPAMWVAWLANLLNVVLNWALIFGHLGSPPLGVVGAGIATAWSRAFMLLALVAIVLGFRLHRGGWTPWSRQALAGPGLREILGYGLPVGAQVSLEVWAWHLTSYAAGVLGPAPIAAHTIALNLASMSFMFPFGISMAASTRVGNLLGGGNPAGARRAAWVAMALGAGVMAGFAVLFLLGRQALPRLWAPEADVLALAAAILPIAGAFQVLDGTQAVGCGILRGMGDTRPAALYNLLGYYALALPIGLWLGFVRDWGLTGLWWGLTIGLLLVASLLVRRIARHGPGAVPARLPGPGAGPMMVS